MADWAIPAVIILLVGSTLFLLVLKLKKRAGVTSDQRRELDIIVVKLTEHLRRNPNDSNTYTKRGIIRHRKGDFAGALEDLDRAIDIDDENVEARYHRGVALHQRGNFAEAMKDYNWIRSNSEDPYYKTAVRDQLRKIQKIKMKKR